MGVKLFDLIESKPVNFKDLKDKKVVIDGNLVLYQFLSTIRQRDGSLLTDSKGNVTSHLTGLLSRVSRLMSYGIKLIFVFDGVAPELKKAERERRKGLKLEAEAKYNAAKEVEDIDMMKKFASRTTRLTKEMVEEAKKLISMFGIPVIQAPSEGEAQASFLVKNNDAYAVGTQDADVFMFGATRVIKNLTISQRKKLPGKYAFTTIKPEMIELQQVLNKLGIDNEQLIVLGMLIGTDFNIGGIKGIGPKKALKLVHEYGKDFDTLFEEIKWNEHFDTKWTEIFYLIKKMPVIQDYDLKWSEVDKEGILNLLCKEHDFSEDRVLSALEKVIKAPKQQSSLSSFF